MDELLTKVEQEKINATKFCIYCGKPVERRRGSSAVGECEKHRQMWEEDFKYGLHLRNRLRELQLIIDKK